MSQNEVWAYGIISLSHFLHLIYEFYCEIFGEIYIFERFMFENEFSNLLKTTVEEFWNTSLNIKLFSLEKNENNLSSGNEYFVTQAEVHSLTYSFKISDSACEILLEKTLGENGEKMSKSRGNVVNPKSYKDCFIFSKKDNSKFDYYNIKNKFDED